MLNAYDCELGRRRLIEMTRLTMPKFQRGWFQDAYYQELDDFAKGKIKKLMIFIPPQHGKLLPSNTPVLTTLGWKNHGDLRKGDFVFGQDGKPKKVLNNFGKYTWNVESIEFQDGKTILAAKEHLWKLQVEYDDKRGRREVIFETQQIFNKKHRRSPAIDCAPALEFPEKVLPIDPYILGCWLGDGHSRQGVLTVGKQDIEHFANLGNWREVKPGIYRVLVPGLSQDLRLNNLILNKHIPIEYLLASKEQRFALLRGLMDTDGCCDSRGNCEFTQKDNQLVKDVYVLLRTLGIKARLKYYDAKLKNKIVGKKGRICFNPDKSDPVFSIPRKRERLVNKSKADRTDKNKLFIKSISNYGIVEGNCIQVEGSMYLAGYDFIPTHNSEGSTRRLPAHLIGKNPDLRIAIVSYNATKARKFNREIRRILAEPSYQSIYPRIGLSNGSDGYSKTFDEFEIVGKDENGRPFEGSVKTVGVDGSLTGDPVDILIMDDLYKNWTEAQSDKTRATVQDWYDSVADTRLHNDSQQLIVFTRWHEYDLAGYLLDKEPDEWTVFLYPALKIGEPTAADPREHGEALYPEKHSREKLEAARARNEHNFDSLYQQNPKPIAGLLFPKIKLHFYDPDLVDLDDPDFTYVATDPADEGGDDFASGPGKLIGDKIYIPEVLYNTEGADFNEEHLVKLIIAHKASAVGVESVFGWVETAKRVKAELEEKNFEGEYRLIKPRTNKHSRILNRSSFIINHFYFRKDYEDFPQYAKFMRNLCSYLRIQEPGRKNKHDDGPDLCEMIASYYEKNFAHLFGTGKN